MNARDLLAAANVGSGVRASSEHRGWIFLAEEPPRAFARTDSDVSPAEMASRADLVAAAVNEYGAHLDLEDVARKYRETDERVDLAFLALDKVRRSGS